MKTRWAALTIVVSVMLQTAPVAADPPRADLSRLVVVGDSLSAGFQNFSLLDRQQVHGYASLVATQARVRLRLPLIADPGIPAVLALVSPGPPPVIVPEPGTSTGRVDPTVQATNLAVPGAAVQDALALRPGCAFDEATLVDVLTDFVLGLPGCLVNSTRSQVEWAEALRPTTVLVWIGNNDTLGAALAADASLVTPATAFKRAYAEMMRRLAATGTRLVVANIPDVTVIPYLTSAETLAASLGLPLSTIGPVLGLVPGDFVIPDAVPLIQPILTGQAHGPLPASVVLAALEVRKIRAATADFNAFIAAQAARHDAALVDIHALLDRLSRRGIVVGGQRLTTAFLGGLFSLDGVHPTNTGYAIIANEFIRALDEEFRVGIRPVSVADVKAEDPLVLPEEDRPATSMGHVVPDQGAALRRLMIRNQP
ncbi:MAG TPA: SGNH/GDSL hydrolase family protein [Methylomirabilota bacterium]|jgi:phospholipase/lecithinase/hemolysin